MRENEIIIGRYQDYQLTLGGTFTKYETSFYAYNSEDGSKISSIILNSSPQKDFFKKFAECRHFDISFRLYGRRKYKYLGMEIYVPYLTMLCFAGFLSSYKARKKILTWVKDRWILPGSCDYPLIDVIKDFYLFRRRVWTKRIQEDPLFQEIFINLFVLFRNCILKRNKGSLEDYRIFVECLFSGYPELETFKDKVMVLSALESL